MAMTGSEGVKGFQILIKQYNSAAYQLQKYRKTLDEKDPLQIDRLEMVSDMLSDLHYAIEWMRRGRRPGSRRGAERTDIYRQREMIEGVQPVKLYDPDKERLAMILLQLTERERQCYLLHFAQGLTFAQISNIFGISRAAVQSYVDRAKTKVHEDLS